MRTAEKSCSIKPRIFPLDPVGLTVLLLSLGLVASFFFFSFFSFHVNGSRTNFLIFCGRRLSDNRDINVELSDYLFLIAFYNLNRGDT